MGEPGGHHTNLKQIRHKNTVNYIQSHLVGTHENKSRRWPPGDRGWGRGEDISQGARTLLQVLET